MALIRTPDGAVPDPVMVTVAAVLLAIGLLMVTSASVTLADRQFSDPFHYLMRQVFAAGLGLTGTLVMLRIPTGVWQQYGLWLAMGAIGLLVLVLVPGLGNTVNGSTRWLRVGGISVMQVSEPARLLLLMYVAGYAFRRNNELRSSLGGFLRPLLLVGVAAVLLLLQPDFGSAVLLMAISLAVLFVAGARLRDISLTLGLVGVLFAALATFSPYRWSRLTNFRDPWETQYNEGFQLTQSLIAIGTGKWTGLGLGSSVQKLFYLPEAHTDFIFAVIAEEFGLLGSLVMIALFGLLIWRAILIARQAAARGQSFPAFLAFGLGVWLALQVILNLGVNMGLLPTKGLTLPLISYGRSSLIVTLMALGLLLRIDLENRGLDSSARRRNARRPGP